MPSPKSKKKVLNKKTKKTLSNALIGQPRSLIRIKRPEFEVFRNDEDFISIVKIGRLINAVAFGIQSMQDYRLKKSAVERRQYNRAFFITAGYISEGIDLIHSLRPKYYDKDYFKMFWAIAHDEQYKKQRKILKAIRNSVAFHLDPDDKSTRPTLNKLRLARYDLLSYGSHQLMDFYVDLAVLSIAII